MKNEDLVTAFAAREAHKASYEAFEDERAALRARLKKLDEQSYDRRREWEQVDDVTAIDRGVAICEHSTAESPRPSGNIHAVGDDINRAANVYLNAHNKTTFGLRLMWRDSPLGPYSEQFMGAGFTQIEALALGREWVVTGILPE